MPMLTSHPAIKIGPTRIPAWAVLTLLIIAGAGAVTGLVLKDSIGGETTIAVSQAIRIDHTEFGSGDVTGDADEVLVTVSDDGMEWAVHLEANNGDIIYIDLPVVNEGEQKMAVELQLVTSSTELTVDVEPIFYWSDRNHDGKFSQEEAVLDQRPTTDKLELERADIVVATGWVDYDNFTADHWFFDGSYVAPGTYGYGGIYGPAYDDEMFSDYDGEDPEVILLDNGDGLLTPGLLDGSAGGDEVILEGRAGLQEMIGPYAKGVPSVGKFFFSDNGGGSAGVWNLNEDIYFNNDGDYHYTTAADVQVDGDGWGSPGPGGFDLIVDGTLLELVDADDNLYWADAGSGDWTSPDHLWYDSGDNGYYNENGESISDAGDVASTDISGTLNPSLDIAFDGGLSQPYVLENSGSITAEAISTIGVEDDVAGIVVGDGVMDTATMNRYIVTGLSGTDQLTTLSLIGDVAMSGAALSSGNTITEVALSGGSDQTTIDGGQTCPGGGIIDLDVAASDLTAINAGFILYTSTDGTLAGDTGKRLVALDNGGGAGSTSIRCACAPGTGFTNTNHLVIPGIGASANNFDVDDFYPDSDANIVAAINDALAGAGTAVYDPAGFTDLYKIDSTSVAANSAVVISAGSTGNDITPDLQLGLAQGGTEATRDMAIFNTPTDDVTNAPELVTSLTSRMAFKDDNLNNVWDNGEDIYEEQTGGAGTYTSASGLDVLVYTGTDGINVFGGSVGTAGSYSYSIDDDDNVMYRDTDHDGSYDWAADTYEPLIYTVSDVDPLGYLTSAMRVLERHGGDWPVLGHGAGTLDAYQLENYFDGSNGHNYYYVDDDNDQEYDYDEAIIDQILGSDLIRLEKSDLAPATDFVIHHGLANLLPFPLVQIDGGETWKFEVPDVNIIGDPLEIRIIVAIEDAAPTGFYEIQGTLVPVNV